MYRRLGLFGLILLFTLGLHADTVYLQNGDQITGTLKHVKDGVVTLETEYAGAIQIKQDAVRHIETDEPKAVRLTDGTVLEGKLGLQENAQAISVPEGWRPTPVPEIEGLAAQGEKPPKRSKPKKWSGAVDAGLTFRSGNTETLEANVSADIKREGKRNTGTLSLSGAYGEVEDELNTRRFGGKLKWQVYPIKKLYLYGLGGAEKDDGRKLDYRAYTGAGLGYDFIKKENLKLAADLGAQYTWERWAPFTPEERDDVKNSRRQSAQTELTDLIGGVIGGATPFSLSTLADALGTIRDIHDPLRDFEPRREEYVDLRIGGYYEQRLFRKSVIREELVLLPNMTDLGAFRATNDLSLTTPLTRILKLRISLETEYDSTAEDSGVEPWDNTLLAGLRYEV